MDSTIHRGLAFGLALTLAASLGGGTRPNVTAAPAVIGGVLQ